MRSSASTSASSSSTKPNNDAESERQLARKLLSWAKSEGAQPMDVYSLKTDEETGVRGVYTSKALEADSIICEVPRKLALEVTTAKSKCPLNHIQQKFWDKCDWWSKLGLLLLSEMQKGESSFRSDYIKALPAAIPTPLHFSQEQLDFLQYEPLVQDVNLQRRSWYKLYDEYCEACEDSSLVASRDEFIHSMECVRSRTFSGPYEGSNWETRVKQYGLVLALAVVYVVGGFGEAYQAFNGCLGVFLFILFRDLQVQRNPRSIRYVLCPVLDMFNHSSEIESDASYEYFRNTFTLTLNRKVEADKEVCISYGKRGNDELMQYYGFVVPGNKYDTYTMCNFVDKATGTIRNGRKDFVADDSMEVEEYLAKRIDMLSVNNMVKEKDNKVVIRPKVRGLTDRCLQTLRILVASDEELKGKTALLDFNSKISESNESKAYKLMCMVCDHELKEVLPTSLEEDQVMLKNLSKANKRFLDKELNEVGAKIQALQFRQAKKKVLLSFIKENTAS